MVVTKTGFKIKSKADAEEFIRHCIQNNTTTRFRAGVNHYFELCKSNNEVTVLELRGNPLKPLEWYDPWLQMTGEPVNIIYSIRKHINAWLSN